MRAALALGLILAASGAIAQSTVSDGTGGGIGQATTGAGGAVVIRDGSEDTRPVPDPTVLTTQQLDRALQALAREVEALRLGDNNLTTEKFNGIDTRFEERDRALEAALASAEKSVAKTEDNFAAQIAALNGAVAEAAKSLGGQIQDLKDRLGAIEGQSEGAGNAFDGLGAAIGVVGVLFGIAFGVVGLIVGLRRGGSTA